MLNDERVNLYNGYDFQKKRTYSTAGALKEILKEFCEQEWVEGAAVIRRDGILLASTISASTETKDACAIMIATVVGAAKNITRKFGKALPKRVIIQSKNGDVIISEAGSKALLVCLVPDRYDSALMFDHLEKTAQKIHDML